MFSTYRKRRSLCTSSLEAIRSAKRRRLENNIKYKASVRKKKDILRKQSNVNKKSSLSFQNNKPTHDTLVQPTNILKNLPLLCSLEMLAKVPNPLVMGPMNPTFQGTTSSI